MDLSAKLTPTGSRGKRPDIEKKNNKKQSYGSHFPGLIKNARREINSRQFSIRYTYTLTAHAHKKAWTIYTLILNSNSNTEQG